MDFGVGVNQNSLGQGKRWYLVHTLLHRELRALLRLKVQAFLTVLARHATALRARRLITVSARIFPGRLFVTPVLRRDRCRSVNGTFGVTSLVMGEEHPFQFLLGWRRSFGRRLPQCQQISAMGQCASSSGMSAGAHLGAAAAFSRHYAGLDWL